MSDKKNYQVKTVYRDGVTTYDLIDAPADQDADTTFNLHLMSTENTEENTVSMELFEVGAKESVAAFNFPEPKHIIPSKTV